ncbi:MAG TPA: hypothetical protein DCL38_03550 [Lachnospiraceae bacterium]|nr:hypothetical protein [Lachnospiraceae bacterium]
MSMQIVFTQILIIFLYIIVGFAAGKTGLINPEQRRYLTKLCTDLILPFTVLSASSQKIGSDELKELFLGLIMMFVLLTLTTLLSLMYHRLRKSSDAVKATFTSLITYPNCTFLGLPLCVALFGNIAILYNAMAMIAFNVLFFSVQFTLFSGKSFNIKNLITPPMVSTVILILMLLLGISTEGAPETVIKAIGSMITPLSLIIIGVMVSENNLLEILKEKRAYVITLLRNILIPALALLMLIPMPGDPMSKLCMLVYLSCPCATLTTIYAIQYDREPELAARSALMSTLFFAVSLPLVILAGQSLLR